MTEHKGYEENKAGCLAEAMLKLDQMLKLMSKRC